MVLSNAERQKRFRQRLKERASIAGLGQQAQEACDRAVSVLWEAYQRTDYGDLDEYSDAEAFKVSLTESRDEVWTLSAICRDWLDRDRELLTDDECEVLNAVVAMDDALKLKASV
ncbi:hypothetical protein [Qipengyuania oceanensis]|uniref:Uncharacterized protein n=1 Tax=Qipengyuania oceanensis TaxID=1463597 RepID=A0A844YIU0_9SPHN|nr:hypothetical protein [Qipengyuania oceanensis]MXO63425.1 hypothetical protein [Qipengyuania oceanensis]